MYVLLTYLNHVRPRSRAIAQAVSRWLPTAAARVRSRVWSSGICGGQSGLGQVFSEYFGFPCQSPFHQLLHNHPHLSSGAGTIGQKWPQYKGLSRTTLAIGFTGTLVTSSLNHAYYSAIADLHNLQFTTAHALGFSVATSRLLATDLNTETSASNHNEVSLLATSCSLTLEPRNSTKNSSDSLAVKAKVEVTLRLTVRRSVGQSVGQSVSKSVSLGVEPATVLFCGAPSLTRGADPVDTWTATVNMDPMRTGSDGCILNWRTSTAKVMKR
jgi:hypothetical protein